MKHKILLSLLLILATLLVSCEMNDGLNTNSEVVLLDFSEQTQTRGMTYFPANIPFYDTKYGQDSSDHDLPYGFWVSGAVMRSLPVLPGVKTMYIKDVESALKDKTVYGYGFPMNVKDIQITSDGIYILYEIMEDNRAFGQIEYYYSIKDKKISYREIISPLLGVKGCDNIFIFELLDVPVKKTLGGYSFKAGRLYENGSEFNFYNFMLSDGSKDSVTETHFLEQDIHMNYKDKETNSASLGVNFYENIQLKKEIDISNREEALNIDDTKVFLQQFFNSPILINERMEYKTIEEFDKTRFVKNNDQISKDNARPEKTFGFPTSFNLDKKIAAAMNCDNLRFTDLSNSFKKDAIVNSFKDCGYKIEKIDNEKDYHNVLDDFVLSMFEKLELDQYVDQREEILADSYKTI